MGGKPSPATSTSTTTGSSSTGPLPVAQPYFAPLYQQGSEAVAKNQALPVPTQFVAGENPIEAQAITGTLAKAPSLGAAGTPLSDMATKIASGYFLNPQNDPTFQGAVDAATAPILRNVTENLLPSVTNTAIRGGGVGGGPSAYGGANAGSAQDIEFQRVLRDFSQNALNTSSAMAAASRAAGMNLIPQAPGIAQGANAQILAPETTTGLAGTQQQAYAQNAIDNLLQGYSANINAPWQGLQQFANLLTTGGYNQGTSQSTTNAQYTPSTPSMATQILQGLLGGAGIATSLFGAGPAGAASPAANIWSTLSGGGLK